MFGKKKDKPEEERGMEISVKWDGKQPDITVHVNGISRMEALGILTFIQHNMVDTIDTDKKVYSNDKKEDNKGGSK